MYKPHREGGPVSTSKLLQMWSHADNFFSKAMKLDTVGNRIDKALELEKRIEVLENTFKNLEAPRKNTDTDGGEG